MNDRITRVHIASVAAIIAHILLAAGIMHFDKALYTGFFPFLLLLNFVLLLWTQPRINKSFIFFVAIVTLSGLVVELIGVNTGFLFGKYHFSDTLGLQLANVPLLIGVNWFLIIYCCGMFMYALLNKIFALTSAYDDGSPARIKALSVILDGATLAVILDWFMEPVAMRLGLWQWATSRVPFYNYFCWLGISILLLSFFHYSGFSKQNKFAVNLFLIQLMFYLIMRTFLK